MDNFGTYFHYLSVPFITMSKYFIKFFVNIYIMDWKHILCTKTWISLLVYVEKDMSFRFLFSKYKYILNLYQSHQYLSLI